MAVQSGLHVEGLSLLRKSIVISVIGTIISGIGGVLAGLGMIAAGLRALGMGMALVYAATALGILISLVAWYFHYNGWERLCRTGVEGFFCTTYTAVKWGMLIGLILALLGSIVSLAMFSVAIRPGLRPGMGLGMALAGMGYMAIAWGLSGLGGLINLIVAIIVLIAFFKVATIYNAPNVKWGAILLVIGALLTFIGIGAIISIIGLVLLYIGLGDAIKNVRGGMAPGAVPGAMPPPPPPPPTF